MWLVAGEFDGERCQRLLQPGKTYKIGRKAPADLIIDSKTVSQGTTLLEVGPFSESSLGDLNANPSLTLHNEHDRKALQIKRAASSPDELAPGENTLIKGGDQVVLSTAQSIELKWLPMNIVVGTKADFARAEQLFGDCAALGIHLIRSVKWVLGGTHYSLSQLKLTPSTIQAAADGAHFVTFDYLVSLLRNGSSTGLRFELPVPASFFPVLANEEGEYTPEQLKAMLEPPRPERRRLFRGATALFIHSQDHSQLASACNLFELCSGKTHTLKLEDANFSSEAETQRTLRPYKSDAISLQSEAGASAVHAPDEGLVVIIEHDLERSGPPGWYRNFTRAARSVNVRMAPRGWPAVTLAILTCQPRDFINSTAPLIPSDDDSSMQGTVSSEPPQQDQALQTAPEATPSSTAATTGSSLPQQDLRPITLTGQSSATPTQAQPQTTTAVQQPTATMASSSSQPEGRRPLRRRNDTQKLSALDQVFGNVGGSTQDPSSSSNAVQQHHAAPQPSRPADYTPSTSNSTGNRLKRRADLGARGRMSDIFNSAASGQGGLDDVEEESERRSTKKYRALLEQEDAMAENAVAAAAPLVIRDSQQAGASLDGNDHTEQHQLQLPSRDGGQSSAAKARQAAADSVDDSASPQPDGSDQQSRQDRQQRTQEVVRSEKGPRGQAAGQAPDSEPHFLEALATKKKGKKALDEFDREFNSMKLTVATSKDQKRGQQDEDEDYKAWQSADIEDLDPAPIGNFVQVDYISLVRTTRSSAAERTTSSRSEWSMRPNFKKFRTKERAPRRPVTLDLQEIPNFGLGEDYRDKLVAEDGSIDTARRPASKSRPGKQLGTNILDALQASDDDDDDQDDGGTKGRKAGMSSRGRRGRLDDAEDRAASEDSEEQLPDLRLTRRIDTHELPSAKTRRKGPAKGHVDDSEDDEFNVGSKATQSSRRGKRSVAEVSEDSDSDGGFKGFKSTSRRGVKKSRT